MAAAPAAEAALVVPLAPGRDAVRWSDDNLLAVACDHTVLILVRFPHLLARRSPSPSHAFPPRALRDALLVPQPA